MIFFRIESYIFPHVEAIVSGGDKGIVFRLYGANGRPPVALYFSLLKDIRTNVEKSGYFIGNILNREEDLRVEGQL